MKKFDFFDGIIILFIILIAVDAIYLSPQGLKAKLTFALMFGAFLSILMKGRISNRILIPVSALLLIGCLYSIFMLKQ